MPEWQDGNLESQADGHGTPYRVLLPPDYTTSDRRYPALYLLHGLFGSFTNWTELGQLRATNDLIIVMPEGGDGWYCDVENTDEMNESRVVRELVPEIDAGYRTIATRDGRSIAGNSMGGYGALKIALKFPEMFSFAASFSGAFEAVNWTDQSPPAEKWDEYRPSISRVFGNAESSTRAANDIFRLPAESSSQVAPAIYFDCGISDSFLAANRRLSRTLRECGVEHKFRILPGGHDWDYWSRQVSYLTKVIRERSYIRCGIT